MNPQPPHPTHCRPGHELLTVRGAAPWTRAILANASHMLVAAIDRGGRLMAFNRRYQEVLRRLYGLEIVPGTNLLEALAKLPPRHHIVLELWRRALDGEAFRGLRTVGEVDREELAFEGSLQCIYDPTGRQIGAALIARDIGPLLRTQRALSKLNLELEHRIRERTAELERRHEQLRHIDERKNRFLAMLGHELRNPLSAIVNGLELWQRTPPDQTERLAHIRDLVARQTGQLKRLVDDLLDVTRIARGKLQLDCEPIDLREPVRSAVHAVESAIAQRNHELAMVLPDEPVIIEGDRARLEQIVVNLLTNAARYTEPGGHIWLTLACEDDTATLSVRDDGIGLSDEALNSIFGEFVQVEGRGQQRDGGLGLGLNLVRRLTNEHGGHVEADSEGPGLGSTFRVHLPLYELDTEPTEPTPIAGPVDFLIVDAHQDHAEALAALLIDAGHIVRITHMGYEALEAALTRAPDIVMIDVALPDTDGRQLCARLRRQPGLEATRLITLSSFGEATDEQRSLEAGCDAHLTKPLHVEQIERLLERLQHTPRAH